MNMRQGKSRWAAQTGRARWVFGLWILVLLSGCGGRVLSPPPIDPDPMERKSYTIGVRDVLRVTVWKNNELNVSVPVRTDGRISIPLADDVQAEGLTAMELKEVITKELSEFILAPDVTVTVMEMNSAYANLLGEVKGPGRIGLARDTRVLDAISSAGGFTLYADKRDIRIIRQMSDGSEKEYRFDYKAYVKGEAPGTNIVLHNGDTIIVTE